ncbi:glycosyl hydrolase family 28-related protein [Haloarcula pellucida]|uniref:Rhamnogalacturonase A/B/Epimerase-like pectate lyase domain-containing protein n=1 Tax=Haloarcula pellucida TaxID=1427151 RepID=A0A830GMT3_9EURY|nr:glycosyl hydrolase family 28-related protein [Halomicroarcula pellucida]MBX0349762.1 hypothetical protein [Halomicroarcula pellucida]GGN94183.1 hypothetical protein GCM10009030_20330 [Halomicroarcula pellucida]
MGSLGGLTALLAGRNADRRSASNVESTTSSAVAREFDGDVDLNGNDMLDVGTIRGGVEIDGASIDSWNVVDVSELGAEPGSDTDLGAVIDDHFDRDDITSAVYYLPEGTYTWNTPVTSRSFEGFGIVGKPQARVECTNIEMPYFISLGTDTVNNADIFIARNITFDVQKENVAASAIIASVDEHLEITNCALSGELDRVVPPYYSIQPTLLTKSGQGFVNISMTDGSFCDPDRKEQRHPMGLAIERDHRGYLVVENSDIEGFINNGIYSAGHNGKVAIRNTDIRNCGAGMLRLGDGDYAYKCKLVNDDAEDRGYSYAALWVNRAGHAVANSIEIVAEQATPSELVRVNGDVDHCTLSNIVIHSGANQFICEFLGSGPSSGQIVTKNWTIYDTGSAQSNAHLGHIDRPNVILENWDVHIDPGSDGKRHGLVVDAPWVDVRGCSFIHTGGGLDLLLDDGADYLRLKNCDFKSGRLYQYSRATTEDAIVADNRFVDGVSLAGEQVDWTTRGPGFQ